MKLVFTSYSSSPEFDDPYKWLKRIEGYTGILEALGKKHTVISIERINYKGELIQKGVQYYFMQQNKKVLLFPFRQHRLISKLRPDVVFINGFIFPLQIIQLRLKLGTRVKIIILHRAEKPFHGLKKSLQKLADQCVNAYLFTSFGFQDEWESTINTQKIYEIIQASSIFYQISKSAAREVLGIKDGLVFLWVASLILRKDPLTVIKAFIEFVHYEPKAKLYMVYQSDELLEQIKGLLHNKKLSDTVVLIGHIQHDQLLHWYNSADFFITGSRYEGSGVAVSEAMSCGCIPIVTNIDSFRKMTENGKYGFLYEAGDSASLVQLLINTKNIDVETERKKVLEHFKNELSFEAIARKIEELLRSI
jgi:glycosyltransferase involved in cell wall biosynthesis